MVDFGGYLLRSYQFEWAVWLALASIVCGCAKKRLE